LEQKESSSGDVIKVKCEDNEEQRYKKRQATNKAKKKQTTFFISPSPIKQQTPPTPTTVSVPHGNSLSLAKECIYCIAKRICLQSTQG